MPKDNGAILSPFLPMLASLSSRCPNPKSPHVDGLSPAIAIEQKAHAGNPRSTVGTMTEIYDYLRVLFARVGIPHCPETGEVIKAISKEDVVGRLLQQFPGKKLHILAPLEMEKQERFEDLLLRLKRQGFTRLRLNGTFYSLEEEEKEILIPFDKKRKNALYLVIDRLKSETSSKARLDEAVENAARIGKGKLAILEGDKEIPFNLAFAVESTGKAYPEITPHTFAFNTAEGACQGCMGLGYQYGAQVMHHPDLPSQSIKGLMRHLWQEPFDPSPFAYVASFLEAHEIDSCTPLSQLPIEQIQQLMQGGGEEEWLTDRSGLRFRWLGINTVLAKAGKSALSDSRQAILPLLQEQTCLSCQGARLPPLARAVTIEGVAIHEFCRWPIEKARAFIRSIQLKNQEKKLLEEVMEQLNHRLEFLCEVGLHYLSLDRSAPSLSGGEAQRIRLARQLGSGLTQVLYVLDEPTIGLHPRDNARLNGALQKLKELGNTLLLVEHDPQTIATADYVLDFGPQAGEQGGHITARGTLKQLTRHPHSLTGHYLSGKKEIPLRTKRRPLNRGFLSIREACKNNLKQIHVDLPVGVLTCLTGVSGSGKSTLLQQVLLPAMERRWMGDSVELEGAIVSGLSQFDKVISIDQNPVGRTIRSDVGTYIDVLTALREFFASLPAAKAKGLQPKHFSYNHRKGMCTACWGLGYRRFEMHFLPAVKVSCEECQGLRLNPLSLEVTYQGKNFGQYLTFTIEEGRLAFQNHPRVTRLLDTLIAVGLGYVKLGQETASLSGGEAQRLKLSRELIKRATGRTLYLLDEPTTGLHSEDIRKLLNVLQQLVDKGNTMVIIEHHLDVIKNADYLIDLGPEAGEKGGWVIGKGTPEELAACEHSWTGKYLREIL